LRCALFITCFNDTLFPATGRATVELLERLGHEVVFPEEQTCCGQMHGNTGYADHGEALVRRWERVFDGFDAVVSPSCHSLRLLHVGDRPWRLLSAVRGIDLVELEEADECCGFGGTFAVKNADTSMAMLGDKLRRVLDTRAEVCTAADNSCLMHIGGALRRQRAGVRTMHLVEILAATE
jgi:L-lactate dehydrogenase complex protein LldE